MERLTDDRFLKDGFYQPKSKDEEKEIRSTGNDLTFERLYKHCAELERQNAELQKQVDELKEKIMNLKTDMISRVALKSYDSLLTTPDDVEEIFGDAYESEFNKFLEQAVKDTAKEIIDDFYLWLMQEYDEKLDVFRIIMLKDSVNLKIQEYRNRYGVEVE